VHVDASDEDVARGWRRYVRILAICWRAAVAEQLEYRADLVAKTLMSAFWLAWAALGVSVYFRFAGDISGWTYGEVLVVVGLFFALNGTRQAFLEPNLERLGDGVRLGTLDHLLTRPVDSQLLVSLRHVDMHNLVDPVLGLVLVTTGVVVSGRSVTVGGLAGFALLGVAALVLLYSLVLGLMCLSVLLVGAEELSTVSFSVVELSRFPVQAYRKPLQTLLVVVPVAFLTTLPAEALLGRLEPVWLLVSPVVALAALAAASVGWRRVLRRYTGASA
jgi:ABC-2 type transport system permease protein